MVNQVPVHLGAGLLAAAIAFSSLTAAHATTVNLREFDRSVLAQAQQARSDFLASYKVTNLKVETFKEQKAWDGHSGTTNPQNTRVGSFSALTDLGPGTGQSVIDGGTGLRSAATTICPGAATTPTGCTA